MSAATVMLRPPDGGTFRAPGETIELVASWSFDRVPSQLEARLFWHVTHPAANGTEEIGIISTRPIGPRVAAGEHRFHQLLPPSPFSFHGALMQLNWAVEFVADGVTSRWDFELVPNGRPIILGAALGTLPIADLRIYFG